MRTRLAALLTAGALLVGCGGGSSTLPPSRSPAAPIAAPIATAVPTSAPAKAPTRVAVNVRIDGSADATVKARKRKPADGSRAPQYVSPSTLGITLSVNGGALTAFDVSNGSPLCTSGASRTCTLPLQLDGGTYTFTMQTFDTAPVAGTIPGGARVLGSSTISQTIVANATNSVTFYIAGQIAGIGATSGYASLPADGTGRSVGITLIAFDAGSNQITAGTNDPYANPIALALSEAGGSGHAYLVVNGSNVGASATITHSSDTVAIVYDGGGSPGYTTTLGASAVGGGGFTFRISPLYVAGPFIAGNHATFTSAGQTSNLAVTEANAPGGVAYNASLSGCAPNATLSGASGSGASYTANLTDVNAPYNGAGCSLTVSDSLGSSIVVPVTFPTPAQDCAAGPLGVQITPSTVGNGSPCPLTVSPATLTLYTPSDATHPGSGDVTISERNLPSPSIGWTSNGCPGVTTTNTQTSAGYGSTFTITLTATSTGTPNTSCTLNYADGNGQTTPGTIIVDPTATALGTVNGAQSGTVAYCYLQLFDPGYPCQPGVDNKTLLIQQFPNLALAPTSPATQLSATVNGSLLSNSGCNWIDIAVQIAAPGYTAVSNGSTAYTKSTELDTGPKSFTVSFYDAAAPTGMYVVTYTAQCAGGPNYQPSPPNPVNFGGNGKGSANVNLAWSYSQ